MGICRNATKVDGGVQRDASPTLSSHEGQMCDTAHDLFEEVASMEKL